MPKKFPKGIWFGIVGIIFGIFMFYLHMNVGFSYGIGCLETHSFSKSKCDQLYVAKITLDIVDFPFTLSVWGGSLVLRILSIKMPVLSSSGNTVFGLLSWFWLLLSWFLVGVAVYYICRRIKH